jgi:serine/threonine protein phosphatase PrpC
LSEVHQVADGALYKYFGLGEPLILQIQTMSIEETDKILIYSDGVSKVLSTDESAGYIERYPDQCVAVKALVQEARAKGSMDDITAMLIQIEEILN